MSDKFKGKYRNESARLQNWDYGSNAAYFITICTKDREPYFGEIINGKMHVLPAGAIAHVLWYEIKNHAKNIELGEFVVMPNHVHGILILNGKNDGVVGTTHDDDVSGTTHDDDVSGTTHDDDVVGTTHDDDVVGTTHDDDVVGTTHDDDVVGTTHALSLQQQSNTIPPVGAGHALPQRVEPPINPGQKRFQNQGKNTVSSIIGSYKSAVTKYCNRLGLNFAWQPRFYDHIIRNDKSFQKISEYIKNNPANWSGDKFY